MRYDHCLINANKANLQCFVSNKDPNIPIIKGSYLHPFFVCFSFSEHVKLFRSDGYEVLNQGGCNSSYPAGTSFEVPFGDAEHFILDISLEYRWSVVNVEYSIVGQTLDSGLQPMAYHTYILAQITDTKLNTCALLRSYSY